MKTRHIHVLPVFRLVVYETRDLMSTFLLGSGFDSRLTVPVIRLSFMVSFSRLFTWLTKETVPLLVDPFRSVLNVRFRFGWLVDDSLLLCLFFGCKGCVKFVLGCRMLYYKFYRFSVGVLISCMFLGSFTLLKSFLLC